MDVDEHQLELNSQVNIQKNGAKDNNFIKLSNKRMRFNDLKKSEHLCPITFKEFQQYTNIKEVIRKRYKNNEKYWNFFEYKSYLFYFLQPFDRKNEPLKQLRIVSSCPRNVLINFQKIPLISDSTETANLIEK